MHATANARNNQMPFEAEADRFWFDPFSEVTHKVNSEEAAAKPSVQTPHHATRLLSFSVSACFVDHSHSHVHWIIATEETATMDGLPFWQK